MYTPVFFVILLQLTPWLARKKTLNILTFTQFRVKSQVRQAAKVKKQKKKNLWHTGKLFNKTKQEENTAEFQIKLYFLDEFCVFSFFGCAA